MIYRILFVLFCLPVLVLGQTTYTVAEDSKFDVKGTSTLSDWTVATQAIEGNIVLSKEFLKKDMPKKGSAIKDVTLKIPVNTLDGGRGATMNDKILVAFDVENNPMIIYELMEAAVIGPKEGTDDIFLMRTEGSLTMAGKSKAVSIPLEGKHQADDSYLFTGSLPVKMSDFGMEPPTAMFGQIVAGDAVTVEFSVKLVK